MVGKLDLGMTIYADFVVSAQHLFVASVDTDGGDVTAGNTSLD